MPKRQSKLSRNIFQTRAAKVRRTGGTSFERLVSQKEYTSQTRAKESSYYNYKSNMMKCNYSFNIYYYKIYCKTLTVLFQSRLI